MKTWKEHKDKAAGVPPPDFCAACPIIISGENHPRNASETYISGLSLVIRCSTKQSRKIEKVTFTLAVGSAGKG